MADKLYHWYSYAYESWEYGAAIVVSAPDLETARKAVVEYLKKNAPDAIDDIKEDPDVFESGEVVLIAN
jgi:hypothetical protein